jgi:hypothetical protein
MLLFSILKKITEKFLLFFIWKKLEKNLKLFFKNGKLENVGKFGKIWKI